MAGSPNDPEPGPPTGPKWEQLGGADVPPALAARWRPIPELLFVLYDPRLGRHCYRRVAVTEDCGLLCFLNPEQARDYVRQCLPPRTYDEVRGVWLDQAHALARERHTVVNCLILIDERRKLHIHYVR